MRCALWPQSTAQTHWADAEAWLARTDATVMVAVRIDPGLCGFIEVGARSIADGCASSPVAYIEGWYVDEDVRGQGVGASLVHAAEQWARLHGYQELASDAELANEDSQHAHAALGFAEIGRAVHYLKRLHGANRR